MIGRALIRGAQEVRSTLAEPDADLKEWLGGTKSKSGVPVDEQSALRSSAVFACVRVVSETVATLGCHTFERDSDVKITRAPWHPYAPALGAAPNPEMLAAEYWENITAYGMLWEQCWSYINRRRNGNVELWPLPPNRCELAREKVATGAPGNYTAGPVTGLNVTLANGEKRFIRWRDILGHRPFGYATKTAIQRHRETIGLSLAAEEHTARFYGQGASVGGFIQMPREATAKQAEASEATFRAAHEGLERSHLIGVLQGGAEWREVGMSPEAAQYIEGRQFSVEETARFFRVPLSKIGHLLRAHFDNIEQENTAFATDTVGPWLVRHEQALHRDLFGLGKYGMPGDLFAEFALEQLLRGDIATRGKAYALAVQWGWMTRNEVRERERMAPLEGLDEPLTPLNMGVLGDELDDPEQARKLGALAQLLARNSNGNGDHSDRLPDYVSAQ